jgi:hypothetical protein
MINQFHSKTSRYYYTYNKYYEYHVVRTNETITPHTQDNDIQVKKDNEKKLKWIEEKLKDCHWFDSRCFTIYFSEQHSLNSMSNATKINRNTLHKAINNVKNYLINETDKF